MKEREEQKPSAQEDLNPLSLDFEARALHATTNALILYNGNVHKEEWARPYGMQDEQLKQECNAAYFL